MFAKVPSIAFKGINTIGIDVEVTISSHGIPCFDIVGLPDKSVAESKHRVKMAFQNSGLKFPASKRIVINLAPANIHKEGSFYDLPIALSILCAQYKLKVPLSSLFFGELSLDGSLRHVRGSFLLSVYAKEHGLKNVFVPDECAREAASVSGVEVYGVSTLSSLYSHLIGQAELPMSAVENVVSCEKKVSDINPFVSVIGQENAKRALMISAAGGHNVLMVGPPGAGKTLLARALPSILPPLTEEETIAVTRIYSAVGKIPPHGSLITKRPFRSPHHTISYAGMIGGGSNPMPGEITLAHCGVLFMDEFSEFPRSVLESLRQPLEDGVITVSRSRGSCVFPSEFVLVAASNPCPCGYLGHPKIVCKCTPKIVDKYRRKLSGPVADRIDLHVNVFPVETAKLSSFSSGVSDCGDDTRVLGDILEAREIQTVRFTGVPILVNSKMSHTQVNRFYKLDGGVQTILNQAVEIFSMSARGYFKTINVARTIADLARSTNIKEEHMAEALQYRGGLIKRSLA